MAYNEQSPWTAVILQQFAVFRNMLKTSGLNGTELDSKPCPSSGNKEKKLSKQTADIGYCLL